MHIDDIIKEVINIRLKLPTKAANPINFELAPVKPFIGGSDIRLIIIGQDPTIKNERQRWNIKYTLNLDKKGALKRYIDNICSALDLSIKNIYATNVYKYFYSTPPSRTPEVLAEHKKPNIELLKRELECFNDCPIITLGEPVLRLIINDNEKVSNYWNYRGKGYKHILPADNILGRSVFPFPHQPSMYKELYKTNFIHYTQYMKNKL